VARTTRCWRCWRRSPRARTRTSSRTPSSPRRSQRSVELLPGQVDQEAHQHRAAGDGARAGRRTAGSRSALAQLEASAAAAAKRYDAELAEIKARAETLDGAKARHQKQGEPLPVRVRGAAGRRGAFDHRGERAAQGAVAVRRPLRGWPDWRWSRTATSCSSSRRVSGGATLGFTQSSQRQRAQRQTINFSSAVSARSA